MKFELKNFGGNLPDFMRSAGYRNDGIDQKTKELCFYKALSEGLYPRFHVYAVWGKGDSATLSLHLDQKAPVYAGSAAHSGDYEGPVVEKEADRIRNSAPKASDFLIRPLD